MMKENAKFRWSLFVAVLAVGLVSRCLPHTPNLSPISALFFLAPVVAPVGWLGFVLTTIGLMVTDFAIGFYPGIEFVYFGYALIGLLGFLQKTNLKSPLTWILNLAAGPTIFFLISNLGVWWSTGMYTRTLEGLVECFVLAIPFFHKSLLAHVLFSGLFCAAYLVLARISWGCRKQSAWDL